MTVKELIEKLSLFPDHLKVHMYTSGDAAAGSYIPDEVSVVIGPSDSGYDHVTLYGA